VTKAWVRTNRLWWDERARAHAESDFYDLAGFRAGRDDLRPFELEDLAVDPGGLDLVHLQCHLGTDTLSWARHGARVVGLDFSAPAIERARQLAEDCRLHAEFVVGDVFDAVKLLGTRAFDVVYTGIGALSWLPDLNRWAEVVASLLRPGGVLYLVEIHPVLWSFSDGEAPALRWDYFAELESDSADGSYTDRSLTTVNNDVCEHNPGFGPVISAAIRAGLVIELVREHAVGVEQVWPFMEQGPDRLWRVPDHLPQLPLLWSLRARRPMTPA
jgi:SAM-dependent methyltransferase